MKHCPALLLCVLVPAVALAQSASPPPPKPATLPAYDRAIAAGYKALTLCSAIFNAGRSEAQVSSKELRGIYPEYDAIVPMLAASIDVARKRVTVPFNDALPPRIAGWRPNLGCTQLPIGASADALADVPRFDDSAPVLDSKAWPLGDQHATSRARGDARALAAGVEAAFNGQRLGTGTLTTGVVVVQRGRIVAERYAEGFGPYVSQRTWSVGKSLAGTLLGIASGQHLIDPAKPAGLAQWSSPGDPRGAITTNQLMRMSSGLYSSTPGNRTDALYFGGALVEQDAAAWPLINPPGTTFRYANNDILLAVRSLREQMHDDKAALAFPFTALLWKIGMTRTVPETDWRGNFILSSQVWSTARDLARLGLLYQDDGMFLGQRVLPEGWVALATTPSGPQPKRGEFGYGATLWLLDNSPGIPKGTYGAFGNRGQFVIVVPSRKVVIVRRGLDGDGVEFDIAKFTADVLKALE